MSKNRKDFSELHLTAKKYIPDGKGGYIPDPNQQPKRKRTPITKPTFEQVMKSAVGKKPGRGRFSVAKKNDAGMNKTEATYALHLDALKMAKEIHEWWFEKITLKLAPDTRLTVDFMIQKMDGTLELHDVKGSLFIYQDDAKVKMKTAAEMFPFRFAVVIPRKQKDGGGYDVMEVKTSDK